MDFSSVQERHDLLTAYAHTYLKEEIWEEQFIKTLTPFRKFLEVAAQSNGKIINFSKEDVVLFELSQFFLLSHKIRMFTMGFPWSCPNFFNNH